jgi:hypothetical protein
MMASVQRGEREGRFTSMCKLHAKPSEKRQSELAKEQEDLWLALSQVALPELDDFANTLQVSPMMVYRGLRFLDRQEVDEHLTTLVTDGIPLLTSFSR